jgi:hypothetical protein
MRLQKKTWAAYGLLVAAGGAAAAWGLVAADAADHLDPPARTNPTATPPGTDRAADIADLYAWHDSDADTATVVLTFFGPNPADDDMTVSCDPDVLYTIHFDTDGADTDYASDIDVHARFGEDDVGNCFLQVENLPGAGGATVQTRVEHVTQAGGAMVYAGLRDDPFFFDLTGFQTTLMTGTLSFEVDRDFFALRNASALVIEMPLTAVSATGGSFRVWATSSRISS